jgi:hypothetical protein
MWCVQSTGRAGVAPRDVALTAHRHGHSSHTRAIHSKGPSKHLPFSAINQHELIGEFDAVKVRGLPVQLLVMLLALTAHCHGHCSHTRAIRSKGPSKHPPFSAINQHELIEECDAFKVQGLPV